MRAFEGRWSSWVVVITGLVLSKSCSLETEAPKGPCTADFICEDGNPCTKDTCAPDGFCTSEVTDSLVPDDGNPCTEDKCVDGTTQNTALDDGTPCGAAGNDLTCSGGKCNCQTTAQCGTSTACQTVECTADTKQCKTTNLPDGTVVDGAGAEDCRQNACESGQIANVPDIADPPADPTPGDCRTNGCSADGKSVDVPSVTDLPADALGDCKKPSCTAEGMLVFVDDPVDVPPNDGNPCTAEGCNGGIPIDSVPLRDGSPCGAPPSCGPNGIGYEQTTAPACLSGACMPAEIISCGLYACNGEQCHLTCADDSSCIADAYCDNGLCKPKGGLGGTCNDPGDCASNFCFDGVCCNVDCGGVCQTCAVPGALGVCGFVTTGTDPAGECPGAEVCNGAGACKKPVGEACSIDSDCLGGECEDSYCCNVNCAGDCRRCNLPGTIGSCENVPSGQTSGACMGGSVCNGSGTCKKINGQPCVGNSDCLTNSCPSEGGSQKVCCNVACNGTCQSCLAAKTGGTDGTCGFVTDKTDPDAECLGAGCNTSNGSGCCNGAGACY